MADTALSHPFLDAVLFVLGVTRDEVEAAWRWVEPIIRGVGARQPRPYAAGTDGPAAADLLIERDGRSWNEDVTR